MILLDLNDWAVSFHSYASWCKENNIHINRVTFTKYRLKKEDFLFFKLKFNKLSAKPSKDYDYD